GSPVSVGQTCDESERYRTFALPDEQVVEFSAAPEFTYVRSCDGTEPAPLAFDVDPAGFPVLWPVRVGLAAGSYFLKSDIATRATVHESARTFGNDCAALDALDLAPGDSFQLVQRDGGGGWFVQLTVTAPLVLTVAAEGPSLLEACPTCAGTGCTPLDAPIRIDAAGPLVLHVPPGSRADGYAALTITAATP